MRIIGLCCLVLLAGCAGRTQVAGFGACVNQHRNYIENWAPCAGLEDAARVENLALGAGGKFTFAAQTNTVMTENSDGAAERIRRDWLAEALRARATCANGYVVDTRRFVQQPQGPFANGGDIVYSGRCL